MTIVYNSLAGTTKSYAKKLAELTGCTAEKYTLGLNIEDEVIYMSWINMGEIAGLSQAKETFNIKAVVAVGVMSFAGNDTEKAIEDIKTKNNIDVPFFALPGNFHIKNLSGMYKMMMKMAVNMMKQKAKSDEEKKALKLFENGVDLYDETKIAPVVAFVNGEPAVTDDSESDESQDNNEE